jgi:tripartite-type tricarboxylate transporter receptor subunit TctC
MSTIQTVARKLRNRFVIRDNTDRSIARSAGLILLATLCGTHAALAQASYPQRTVSLIVPFAAGGATDALTRILVTGMKSAMDGKVIVENKPGALTQIGIQAAISAPADGYTLAMGGPSTAILTLVNKGFTLDLSKELVGVAGVGESYLVICVNAKLPVKTLDEFIKYAKANPGVLNYGAQGASDYLANNALSAAMGINVVNVRYGGGGPVKTALIAGDVHYSVFYAGDVAPLIEAGQVRPIATTGLKRHPEFPNLPTIAEATGTQVEYVSWAGVFAKAGTPQPVIDKVHLAVDEALRDPETLDRIKKLGFEPMKKGPEEMTSFLRKEIETWNRVAKETNFKPE